MNYSIKSVILSIGVTLFSFIGFELKAQIVANDSLTMGANYVNDIYYHLEEGSVKSSVRTEWDLALQVESFEAAIRTNDIKGVQLYLASDVWEDFDAIKPADTVGKFIPALRLYNSDTIWNDGSFNSVRKSGDATDYGWGTYDQNTHIVSGNKIYFLVLSDKTVKKVRVLGFEQGFKKFNFEIANLDNSEKTTISFDRTKYSDKNFGYYSFEKKDFIDLEPQKNKWDFVATRYYTKVQGMLSPVTGILHNSIYTRSNESRVGVSIQEVKTPDLNSKVYDKGLFRSEINIIGSDWKNFDVNNKYVITDSTIYFIKSVEGSVWKLVFTNISSPTGTISFYKERVFVSVEDQVLIKDLILFPTSINSEVPLTISSASENSILNFSLLDNLGKVVFEQSGIDPQGGKVILSDIPNGIYHANIKSKGGKSKSFTILVNR